MPTPEANETKDHYLDRCMAYPDLQDKESDQRYAICNSLWDKHHETKDAGEKLVGMDDQLLIYFGDSLKALGDPVNGMARVGGYLVRFGGPQARDASGDYFTAETYLGPKDGDGAEALFHHSQPVKGQKQGDWDHTFQPIKTRRDEYGIFAETVLDMADEYEAKVYELTKAGKLGWSSGSAAHRVRKSADGRITQWPIVEGSLTPEPCEPRNRGGIRPFKSLMQTEEVKAMGTTDAAAGGALVPAAEQAAPVIPTELDAIKARLVEIESGIKMLTDALQLNPSAFKNDDETPGEMKADDEPAADDEQAAGDEPMVNGEPEADLEDEYKAMSPIERAKIHALMNEITENQKRLDKRAAIKARHQRRLMDAAQLRGAN